MYVGVFIKLGFIVILFNPYYVSRYHVDYVVFYPLPVLFDDARSIWSAFGHTHSAFFCCFKTQFSQIMILNYY